MYIEAVPNRSSPPAILLRESYRAGGKVKKRTLCNLTDWPTELIEGLRTLLKGGTAVPPGQETLTIRRALPHGHVAPSSATCAPWASTSGSGRPATAAAISCWR